jgi:molybdopterin/thiamine biosynthesis adenylyltransferase
MTFQEEVDATVTDLSSVLDGLQASQSNESLQEETQEELPPLENTAIRVVQEMSNNELSNVDATEIPNKNNLKIEETTARFSSADWYNKVQQQTIILAGVGGIGSWVALLLSRMQPKHIIIYDDDDVNVVNLAGQFYSRTDVGVSKISAVCSHMRGFSNYYAVTSYQSKFTAESDFGPIMICGFDNMEARKIFYNSWKYYVENYSQQRSNCLFIDGRLSAEELQVFCITGDNRYNMKRYEENWLFDSSEAEHAICSYKQTTYMANMIASIITNVFVNFCANLCDFSIERDVPFLTRYDGLTMYLKTE